MKKVFAQLLCISSSPTQFLLLDSTLDSPMMVSQANSQGGCCGNLGKGRHFKAHTGRSLATPVIASSNYMANV